MKWKNISQPNAGYFITSTIRNSLPLLNHPEAREIVYSSLEFLRNKYNYKIIGYCLMPEHIHLLIQAEGEMNVSKVMEDFKRFTAKQILNHFKETQDQYWLGIFEAGAYSGQKFSVWQETFRSELVYNDKFLLEKLNYIHNNPLRRGLAKDILDWPHSSAPLYYAGKPGRIPVDMLPLSVSA